MQEQRKSAEEIVAAIAALDLDPIKFKLMNPDEGEGWDRETADRLEREYRRFLILIARHPAENIVPSRDVDKFWHGHILDTAKYAEDCGRTFGTFLHHFPYFGMRGEQDAAALAEAARATGALYEKEFGETAQSGAFCVKAAPAFCVKAAKEAAFCVKAAAPEAAFCVKAAGAAFCVKASQEAAFCVKAAGGIDLESRPALAAA